MGSDIVSVHIRKSGTCRGTIRLAKNLVRAIDRKCWMWHEPGSWCFPRNSYSAEFVPRLILLGEGWRVKTMCNSQHAWERWYRKVGPLCFYHPSSSFDDPGAPGNLGNRHSLDEFCSCFHSDLIALNFPSHCEASHSGRQVRSLQLLINKTLALLISSPPPAKKTSSRLKHRMIPHHQNDQKYLQIYPFAVANLAALFGLSALQQPCGAHPVPRALGFKRYGGSKRLVGLGEGQNILTWNYIGVT